MGELDDIVLSAFEETALEPKRLRKVTEALVSRASARNEALAARQKQLDGALLAQSAAFAASGELASSFAQDWRTGAGETGNWEALRKRRSLSPRKSDNLVALGAANAGVADGSRCSDRPIMRGACRMGDDGFV